LSLQNWEQIFPVTNDSLTLLLQIQSTNIKIATYNDHRMAMAFAPLALKVPIIIENLKLSLNHTLISGKI
jgi:5-enolpyruvylshikimate-3-phosphate synthase